MSSAQQELADRLWWHGYFVRAGRLTGVQKPKQSIAKANFAPRDEWHQKEDSIRDNKQDVVPLAHLKMYVC